MPRAARLIFPDLAIHIVQRGNNRGRCFFSDFDYFRYLTYLEFFAARFGCAVHAYCLMTNHVHLLITPRAADACAHLMKYLGQCYVQELNRLLGRTGTLWEGRFRSCLVNSERYVLACYRYIELNPVRAGLAGHPSEYRWSSYRGNAGGQSEPLLDPHPTYPPLSTQPERRRRAYAALFDAALDAPLIDEIRLATRAGRMAGVPPNPRGRPPRKMGSVPI